MNTRTSGADTTIVDALMDAVHAADEMMDHGRALTARGAQWRNESLSLLRKTLSAQEIADRLGISRSAVYAALGEAPEEPRWLPLRDGRLYMMDEGTWRFFCANHEPGRPVIQEFATQVEAEQFARFHDDAMHP